MHAKLEVGLAQLPKPQAGSNRIPGTISVRPRCSAMHSGIGEPIYNILLPADISSSGGTLTNTNKRQFAWEYSVTDAQFIMVELQFGQHDYLSLSLSTLSGSRDFRQLTIACNDILLCHSVCVKSA